jgi:hypothetical protein
MNRLVITTMLTLATTPVVMSLPAIAKPSSSSPTNRAPTVLQPPHTATTEDRSEQINTLNRRVQPMQQNAQKTGEDKLNQSYPAYCEFYLFNVEPGSWQFQQDIQRCLYGQ